MNQNQKKFKGTSLGLLTLSLGKVEMVVMLGCFEEWGWWLVVLGCRRRSEVTKNWPEQCWNSDGHVEGDRGETEEREWVWSFGCEFLTYQTLG